jgi:hypothetical protein
VVPAVRHQLPEAGREAREVRPKGLVCLSVSLDQGGRRSTPPECTRPEGEERSLPELLPDRLHSDNAKMEGGSARSPASRTRCCSAGPGEAESGKVTRRRTRAGREDRGGTGEVTGAAGVFLIVGGRS